MAIEKLDLKRDLKHLYNPSSRDFAIVDVPQMCFLMVDGRGDPNTVPEYREAVEALYSVAYTLKFAVKKNQNIDYPVMALEGLWWSDDPTVFALDQRQHWHWTMMIMVPEFVSQKMVAEAKEQARKKKALPALDKLYIEPFHEGLCVQIMHIGPYKAEGPTIARMHDYIHAEGYVIMGKHHEIYLGDPRRSAPEKLKTVLRQPMRVNQGKHGS